MADTVRHPEPHVHQAECVHVLGRAIIVSPIAPANRHGYVYCARILSNTAVIQEAADRKPRKSVAFSQGTTIVDSDGQVTESNEANGGKSSAESHSTARQDAHMRDTDLGLISGVTGDADKEVEEVTDMFADLAKKVRVNPALWQTSTKRTLADERAEEEEVVQEEGGRRRRGGRGRLCRTQEEEEGQQEEGRGRL